MELKINTQKDNKLLNRIEVEATVTFTGATPSRADMVKEIAKQAKADEKLVVIKHIYTDFGTTKATVRAFAYTDEATLKASETVVEEKVEEKPAEAAPAPAAPPAEAPKAEEKSAAEPAKEEAPKEEPAKDVSTEETPKEEAPKPEAAK
jgi:ribosomal protein S24E